MRQELRSWVEKNALRVRESDDTFSDNRIEARSNGSRSWRFLKCAERPAHEKEIAKSEIKKWSKSMSELLHFLVSSQESMKPENHPLSVDRRSFLRQSSVAAAGLGFGAIPIIGAEKGKKETRGRDFGEDLL